MRMATRTIVKKKIGYATQNSVTTQVVTSITSDSPAHGQHTAAVLQRLGRSEQDIAALIEQGVAAGQPTD